VWHSVKGVPGRKMKRWPLGKKRNIKGRKTEKESNRIRESVGGKGVSSCK